MCAEPPSGSQLCNSRRLVLVCSMELSMSPVAADRRSGGIVEPVCMRARKRHAERRGCANARAGGVGASTRKKLPVALDRLWLVVIFAARKPVLQRRHPVSPALGVRRGETALAGTGSSAGHPPAALAAPQQAAHVHLIACGTTMCTKFTVQKNPKNKKG